MYYFSWSFSIIICSKMLHWNIIKMHLIWTSLHLYYNVKENCCLKKKMGMQKKYYMAFWWEIHRLLWFSFLLYFFGIFTLLFHNYILLFFSLTYNTFLSSGRKLLPHVAFIWCNYLICKLITHLFLLALRNLNMLFFRQRVPFYEQNNDISVLCKSNNKVM